MKKLRNGNNKEPRRVLRTRKRKRYIDSSIGSNSDQQTRPYRRRHRSCEPNMKLRKNSSLLKFRRKTRSCSASSLKSVVYIGRYRKIPKLIVLDDSSDEEQPKLMKRRLRKRRISNISSHKDKNEKIPNDSQTNLLRNEGDLLNMLNKMHINTSVVKTVIDCSNTHKCQT